MNNDLIFTDGRKIPIGTIYCIGSNYAEHNKEMGSVASSRPVIFIKPPAAYIKSGEKIVLPDFSDNVHHEVELVVCVLNDAQNLDVEESQRVIAGYAVGIDVTLRDIQMEAKKEGKPWATAKGFYTSAPLSNFISSENINYKNIELLLSVNGETRQNDFAGNMISSPAEIVSYISKVFTLRAGDCIFTGTPSGIGKIKSGDNIHAELKNLVSMDVIVE